MRFVDEVTVIVRSGKGGDGSMSFLREKFRPKGGPDGGDGGHGGDVVVAADPQLATLLDLRYQQHHFAGNGQPGMGRQMYGKNGEDRLVRVPVGTVVTDAETGELIADLSEAGSRVVVAKGGRRGRGNIHFATSTNQAPMHFEPGGLAEDRRVKLTLKLLADVGLVGFPNAGKSTLISCISAARPKIAEYPFTTLVPNLGLVRTSGARSFVVADIPGLIKGASQGAGLGHQFLRHVERVSIIAVLLDRAPDEGRDPIKDYRTLMTELHAYSPALLDKPRMIVLTKADLPDTREVEPEVRLLAETEGLPFLMISAVQGEGLRALCDTLQQVVDRSRSEAHAGLPLEERAPGD